jgi:deoxyribodipyrimidine photolyase-like uncharacterized protein
MILFSFSNPSGGTWNIPADNREQAMAKLLKKLGVYSLAESPIADAVVVDESHPSFTLLIPVRRAFGFGHAEKNSG